MRNLEYVGDSWQGVQRETNKDSFHVLIDKEYAMFFVFDGVSSAKNAKLGVDAAIEFSQKNHEVYLHNHDFHLSEMIQDMNVLLLQTGIEELYTTCCIAYIPFDDNLPIKITHLGDSRIYGVDKNLTAYTNDHNNPVLRNMLTKCLGLARLKPGDFYETGIADFPKRMLICTDGFYHVMETNPDLFLRLLNMPSLNALKDKIKKTIAMQNFDDATYLLVSISQ
jgi:serine/threonine protein phosphatase PrpC